MSVGWREGGRRRARKEAEEDAPPPCEKSVSPSQPATMVTGTNLRTDVS